MQEQVLTILGPEISLSAWQLSTPHLWRKLLKIENPESRHCAPCSASPAPAWQAGQDLAPYRAREMPGLRKMTHRPWPPSAAFCKTPPESSWSLLSKSIPYPSSLLCSGKLCLNIPRLIHSPEPPSFHGYGLLLRYIFPPHLQGYSVPQELPYEERLHNLPSLLFIYFFFPFGKPINFLHLLFFPNQFFLQLTHKQLWLHGVKWACGVCLLIPA